MSRTSGAVTAAAVGLSDNPLHRGSLAPVDEDFGDNTARKRRFARDAPDCCVDKCGPDSCWVDLAWPCFMRSMLALWACATVVSINLVALGAAGMAAGEREAVGFLASGSILAFICFLPLLTICGWEPEKCCAAGGRHTCGFEHEAAKSSRAWCYSTLPIFGGFLTFALGALSVGYARYRTQGGAVDERAKVLYIVGGLLLAFWLNLILPTPWRRIYCSGCGRCPGNIAPGAAWGPRRRSPTPRELQLAMQSSLAATPAGRASLAGRASGSAAAGGSFGSGLASASGSGSSRPRDPSSAAAAGAAGATAGRPGRGSEGSRRTSRTQTRNPVHAATAPASSTAAVQPAGR